MANNTSFKAKNGLVIDAASNANLLWSVDAAGNIGAPAGVNRPANVYLKSSLDFNGSSVAVSSTIFTTESLSMTSRHIQTASNYAISTNDWVISFWMKSSGLGGTAFGTGNGINDSNGWFVSIASGGNTGNGVAISTNGANAFCNSITVNDGSWHHIAIYGSSLSTFTFYLDGVSHSSTLINGNWGNGQFASNTNPLKLGGMNNLTGFWTGDLCQMVYVGAASLSGSIATIISDLYNSGAPKNISGTTWYSNALNWWYVGDGDSNTLISDHKSSAPFNTSSTLLSGDIVVAAPSGGGGGTNDILTYTAATKHIFSGNVINQGQVQSAVGSAAAPEYSFTGSLGTGMYSSAANVLDFATNGVDRWQIDSSGNLLAVADNSYSVGTVSANRPNNIYAANSMQIGGTSVFVPGGLSGGTFLNVVSNVGKPAVSVATFSNSSGVLPVIELFKAGGTQASPTAVAAGQTIGNLRFSGYDGAAANNYVSISAISVNGYATDKSTQLQFNVSSTAALGFIMSLDPTGSLTMQTGGGNILWNSDGLANIGAVGANRPNNVYIKALMQSASAQITNFSVAGVVHNDASGNLSSSLIVNADVDPAAAIAYSKLALSNSIVNADINSAAAIAYSKLALSNSIKASDQNSQSATSVQPLFANGSGGAAYRSIVAGDLPNLSSIYLPLSGGTMSGAINMGANKITNLAAASANGDAVRFEQAVLTDGSHAITGNQSFSGTAKITNLLDPVLAQDGATKAYVDNAIAGLSWKEAAQVASVANINISSAPASIDGYSLVSGDRILLKDQTAPAENGLYSFSAAAAPLVRTYDAATWNEIVGMVVYIEEGSTNTGAKFVNTNVAGGTLGVTAITYTVFAAASALDGVGSPGYNAYWTGTHTLAAEQYVAAVRGGLATDASAFTGVVKASAGVFSASSIVNADVDAAAAIAYSKLALSNSIVNADINSAAAIAYSKLNLSSSIVSSDLASSLQNSYFLRLDGSNSPSAAVSWNSQNLSSVANLGAHALRVGNSTLTTFTAYENGLAKIGEENDTIVSIGSNYGAGFMSFIQRSVPTASGAFLQLRNAVGTTLITMEMFDLSTFTTDVLMSWDLSSHAINLAHITASRALITDGSSNIAASATTSTELGYVSGVSSSIQTQLNGKQATGNYITALTSDVSASGPGSVAATVNSVGGSSAANIHSAELAANAATAADTASTIVKRDASGNFSASQVNVNKLQIGAGGFLDSGSVSTTDATPTTVYSLPLASNSAYIVTIMVVGRRTDSADRVMVQKIVGAYNEGGSCALASPPGSDSTLFEAGDMVWDASFSISGTNLICQVTGGAGANIDWKASVSYQVVS